MVLKNSEYFIEASDEATIKKLVSFEFVRKGMQKRDEEKARAKNMPKQVLDREIDEILKDKKKTNAPLTSTAAGYNKQQADKSNKEKLQNYKNLHSEFMQLINAGESDYDDDYEENKEGNDVEMEESKKPQGQQPVNDVSMQAESTVPTFNENRLDPGIIRIASNRF